MSQPAIRKTIEQIVAEEIRKHLVFHHDDSSEDRQSKLSVAPQLSSYMVKRLESALRRGCL